MLRGVSPSYGGESVSWRGEVERRTGRHWALSVACSYCLEVAGHPCIDQRAVARKLKQPHPERREAARRAEAAR